MRPWESPAHPPKRWCSPGRRFPPCLPGITVCVGMGRRKNMMGNREIKITPVKTGCWKAGNGAGLQGCLAVEGCLSVCRGLSGAARLSQGLFGGKHPVLTCLWAPTKPLRQRQGGSAGSRLVSCAPQGMTDHGYLPKCARSPSLNTCLLSCLSDEGHKPFPTAHQPGIIFI